MPRTTSESNQPSLNEEQLQLLSDAFQKLLQKQSLRSFKKSLFTAMGKIASLEETVSPEEAQSFTAIYTFLDNVEHGEVL